MIRHTVILRFPPETTPAEKAAHYAELGALRGHLPGILDYQTFVNVSVEDPVVHGFRDGFWFDFTDAAARDTYLTDPAHQAAGGRLVARCGITGITVIDVDMPAA